MIDVRWQIRSGVPCRNARARSSKRMARPVGLVRERPDGTVRRHTRVFDVDGGCLVVELAERGGLAASDFDALVGTIETDVRHAKRSIEAQA